MDREAAWAAVHHPETDGATLAAIAQQHPEFRDAILRHPSCYAGLREWIAACAPPPSSRTETVEEAGHIDDQAPVAARRPRRIMVIAAIAAGALVLGGGGAWAVALVSHQTGRPAVATAASTVHVTGTPPMGGTFSAGAELAWQAINKTGQGDVEAVSDPRIWMFVFGDKEAAPGATLQGVDARTGTQKWSRHVSDWTTCASQSVDGSAYCYVSSSDGESQMVERISLADGSVQKTFPMATSNPDVSLDTIVVLRGAVIVVQSEGADAPGKAIVTKIPPDLSSAAWTTSTDDVVQGVGDAIPILIRVRAGLLSMSDSLVKIVLDFATGQVVGNAASSSPVDVIDLLANGTIVGKFQTGTMGTHAAVAPADQNLEPVDFASSAEPPSVPIFYQPSETTGDAMWVGSLSADGASVAWQSPAPVSGQDGVFGAAEKGHVALVDTVGHVSSIDASTGAVQWTATYSAPSRDGGDNGTHQPTPFYLDAHTLVLSDWEADDTTPILYAFDANNGQQLWTLSGVGLRAHYGDEPDTSVFEGPNGIGPLAGTGSVATLTDPVPTAAGLPACPIGMKPVSWSTYPGGHVLVCSGSTRYVVDVVVADQARTCSTLAFDATGYTLSCTGVKTIRVLGGGAAVQVGSGSSAWTQPASATWSTYAVASAATTSTGFGSSPAKLPAACPVGSVPLSLSTWRGGWLLVCGTDAMHASSFTYRVAGRIVSGGSMAEQDGRYCGTDTNGAQVCASGVPAVVSVTPRGGSARQYSVAGNYFPFSGVGGSGRGTGAYGVKAPKDEAADQVRYLTEILQKSEQGRAAVSVLAANIQACEANPSGMTPNDAATAASVVDNRQGLLSALASTPVDKIGGGARLVAELTLALTVSLQVDQQYVTAVNDILGGDCTDALGIMQGLSGPANQTNVLKQTFVEDWNSTIVGSYPDAPTLDPSKI